MDRLSAFAGVPLLNGPVVLQAGVAADPRSLGNLRQERCGILLLERLAGGDGSGPPFLTDQRGFHELVAHADGEVLVLVHDAAVSVAIVRAVIPLLDERPSLLLFLHLGLDELLDIPVPITEGIHLGRTASFAAGLHYVGYLVVDAQEGKRTAGPATAAELFSAGADRCEVGARPGAELEQHGLAIGQMHDRLHVVIHGLDETGAALRVFVLGLGAFCLSRFGVVEPVAAAGLVADVVFGEKAHVEPDRGIEGAVLIQAQPDQFLVEHFAICLLEVTILHAPVGDGAANPVDQLPHRSLALRSALLTVEILGDHYLGGEQRPTLGHLHVLLLKDDLIGVVRDLRSAAFPFHLVKGTDPIGAEYPIDW